MAREEPVAIDLLQTVRALVAELRPGAEPLVSLDSHLERDLGLDSLARVELLARIEHASGLRLPSGTLTEAETPRQLQEALRCAHPEAHRAQSVPQPASPGPDEGNVGAPEAAATLVEVLRWHAQRWPQRIHIRLLQDDAEVAVLRYGELLEVAERVAGALQRDGLQPGEAVAIMLPTGLDFFTSFCAALFAGGVPVPMYPPSRPSQLEDHLRRQAGILRNCGAPVLITVPEAKLAARVLVAQVPGLVRVHAPDELREARADVRAVPRSASDLALLQYTSGSTGNPKGVMLSHANLLANIRAWSKAIAVKPDDVCVSWLPFYHDMGLIGTWLGSLYNGNPLVLMSPLDFLSRPLNWLRAIHRYRGTLSAAPNFAFELVVRHTTEADLEGLDLSSLRRVVNGAEPVSPDTLERFGAHLVGHGFRREAMTPLYGLAENAVGLTVPLPGGGPRIDRVGRDAFLRHARAEPAAAGPADGDTIRFVGCGRPLPGHEIRIGDEAGRELPERQVGRIEFRGPSATAGYFRNDEETARLRRGDWLDSGDLGYLAEGELFVTGRVKDLIIRGGRNLYPYELEEAIGALPGVRRGCVAVFGAADPATASERLVAVVETRERDGEVRKALRRKVEALALERLGLPFDEVVLAPPHSVLKTSSGKIRRAATRDLYLTAALGDQRSPRIQVLRLAATGLAAQARRLATRVGALLWGGWAWLMLLILAPPVWLAVVALRRPALGWRAGHLGACLLARLIGVSIEVHGREVLMRQVACVVAANHASYVDGLVMVAASPRPFAFVAKRELSAHPIAGPFLRGLGAVFVERFDLQESVAAARDLGERACAGASLFFFPEGTFVRRAGLREFRLGAFVAAAESGLAVVPVALRGTRELLPDESWMPRRATVVVRIGQPVAPDGKGWAGAVMLRDAVRAEILANCGESDITV